MAFGILSLTPEQFGLIRPADFYLMLEAKAKYSELEWRRHAELIRMQTATLVNIQIDKKDQLKPEDLWQFTWDEQKETDELSGMTDEQIEAHNARLAAML